MGKSLVEPEVKRATSSDVARLAGVCRSTVSYVLSGRRNATVPEETCRRVLLAAEALNYRPNTLAQSLKAGRTKLLGVFMRIREDSFHDRILHGIHEECAARGHSVLLAYLDPDERIASKSLMRLLEFQIAGAIRVIGSLTESEVRNLNDIRRQYGTPFVMVDDRANSDDFDCIVTDDVEGARTAVRHLIDLGHRRIAHLAGGSVRSTGPDRLSGYLSTMAEAGLPVEDGMIGRADFLSGADSGEVDLAMEQFLSLPRPPTAIFAANDRIAALAREAARARGVRTPEDVSIIGYGDLEIAEFTGLTTIDQEPETLGRLAVRRVFERLANPGIEPAAIYGKTRLITRKSTLPLKSDAASQ